MELKDILILHNIEYKEVKDQLYFNATELANDYGKELSGWSKSQSFDNQEDFKERMAYLEEELLSVFQCSTLTYSVYDTVKNESAVFMHVIALYEYCYYVNKRICLDLEEHYDFNPEFTNEDIQGEIINQMNMPNLELMHVSGINFFNATKNFPKETEASILSKKGINIELFKMDPEVELVLIHRIDGDLWLPVNLIDTCMLLLNND